MRLEEVRALKEACIEQMEFEKAAQYRDQERKLIRVDTARFDALVQSIARDLEKLHKAPLLWEGDQA